MKKFFFLNLFLNTLLILCSLSSNAQINSKLTGKILNVKQQPIEFASVYLENSPIGTICNENGEFSLSIPTVNERDSVVISQIGYKRVKLQLSKILDEHNFILSEEQQIQLKPIEVFSDNFARKIIEKTISNLDKKFCLNPYEQEAYFKFFLKSQGKVQGIYESVFNVLHLGYNLEFDKSKYKYLPTEMISVKEDRATLFKLRYDKRGFPLTGWSVVQAFRLLKDITYNGILSRNELDRWSFTIKEKVIIDEKEVFIINFTLTDKYIKNINKQFQNSQPMRNGFYDGNIYVDSKDLEIKKIELNTDRFMLIYKKCIDKATGHIFKPITSNMIIEFKKYKSLVLPFHIVYTDNYEDYGWNDIRTDVTEHAEIIVNNLLVNQTTDWSYINGKYGPLLKMDQLYYQPFRPIKVGSYNKFFWTNFSDYITDWKQVDKSLPSINSSLDEEFMLGAGKYISDMHEIFGGNKK